MYCKLIAPVSKVSKPDGLTFICVNVPPNAIKPPAVIVKLESPLPVKE